MKREKGYPRHAGRRQEERPISFSPPREKLTDRYVRWLVDEGKLQGHIIRVLGTAFYSGCLVVMFGFLMMMAFAKQNQYAYAIMCGLGTCLYMVIPVFYTKWLKQKAKNLPAKT